MTEIGILMQLTVNDKLYNVRWWQPGAPMFEKARALVTDTETEYIIKGSPIKPVLAQICNPDTQEVLLVHWAYFEHFFPMLNEKNPEAEWVFHNAAFDLKVIGDPRYQDQYLLDLLRQRRVVDTGVRFVLRELQRGKFVGLWSLDYACDKLIGIKVDKGKDKSIEERERTSFKQYNPDGTPWEPTMEHLKYAALDAIYTAQCYEVMPAPYPTEDVCLYGNIALEDISDTGMLVDEEERVRLLEEFTAKAEMHLANLNEFGWIPGKGMENTTVTENIMQWIEEVGGYSFPRTKGTKAKPEWIDENGVKHAAQPAKPGKIQMTDEALEQMTSDHPFITEYKAYHKATKVISTYLKPNSVGLEGENLYDRIGVDGRVHPSFKGMVKTGRTSCSKPNIQNVPRDGGIRGIYKARPGYVLYACDYSQAELCALAQNCYTKYGFSKMLEVINSGTDLHLWVGEKIFIQEGGTPEEWEVLDAKKKKGYRQMSKALNFGLPGGLGVKTFVAYAKNSYGVILTEERAAELIELWKDAFPETKLHLQPAEDGIAWGENDFGEKESYTVFRAETISGRVRSKASFCSAANYSFQGLAADGAKYAMWYLWQEGFRMVNFIHDEVLFELKEDDPLLQEKILRIKELMLFGMRLVLPDVSGLKCEGAMMRRWRKEAEEELNEDGTTPIYEDKRLEEALAAG